MKIKNILVAIITTLLALTLVGCDFSNNNNDILNDNEVSVRNSESSFVGNNYEKVVKKLSEWGFTNIETRAVFDIIFGFTSEGSTKTVSINGLRNFKKGDIFNNDALVIVTYSMKESSNNGDNKEPNENEVKIDFTESMLIGTHYEDVFENLTNLGFSNIETKPVYDIILGFTSEGSTKTVSISDSRTFKKGDIFNKDVPIIIIYSMKSTDDPTKQKYTVTWQYEDGTVIQTDQVLWGNLPKYKGVIPSKPSTDTIKYVFNGWSPEIKEVKENTIYIAQFSKNEMLFDISYLITETITQIASGGVHSLALTSNGQLYTWGYNSYGQLGDGTTKSKDFPVNITSKFNLKDDESIIKIQAGSHHSLALTSKARLFSWGKNDSGIIGDGTRVNKLSPIEITNYFDLNGDEKILNIYSGERADFSMATTTNGKTYSWGNNEYGQLGDGTIFNKSTPVNITSYIALGIEETIDFSLGGYHTIGLTSSGRVYSWGRNNVGQLGQGITSNSNKLKPTLISNSFSNSVNEKIVMVEASSDHSMALSSSGKIFSWGFGGNAQHGDGTYVDKNKPLNVTSFLTLKSDEVVTKISSVGSTSFALTSKNRIFSWGSNVHGQSGYGNTISKAIPIEITSNFELSDNEYITEVLGGFYHSLVITSKGRLFGFGWNTSGQLTGKEDQILIPFDITNKISEHLEIKVESYKVNDQINSYIPTLNGYTFDGWYIDQLYSKKYEYGLMPPNNLNLYGRWISIV